MRLGCDLSEMLLRKDVVGQMRSLCAVVGILVISSFVGCGGSK